MYKGSPMKPSTWSAILALFLLTQFPLSSGTQQTTLELSISRRAIDFGERVTLTAVLEDLGGNPIQGAQILFFSDDEFLGERPTDVDGTARFILSPDPGMTILVAQFADTESYSPSTSVPILLEVNTTIDEDRGPSFETLTFSTIFLISILTLGGVGSIILYVYSKSSKSKKPD